MQDIIPLLGTARYFILEKGYMLTSIVVSLFRNTTSQTCQDDSQKTVVIHETLIFAIPDAVCM